jgi:hypothetical protein
MKLKQVGPIQARRILAALAASVFALVNSAVAIPPHPHDQGKVAYPNPLPNPFTPHTGGANDANHSHVGGIAVKEVNPSPVTNIAKNHMVDTAATQTWRSYASWDNRTYRATDLAGTTVYGHGYIEPNDNARPRYQFNATVPGGQALIDIKASITAVWQAWEAAAKAEGQNSRTTPDNTPLLTNVSFREIGAGDAGAKEIDIDFVGTTPGNWIAATRKLEFATAINARVRVSDANGVANNDWHVSSDNLALNNAGKAWGAQTQTIALPWNFTAANPTTAGVPNGGDLDYMCVNAAGCGGGINNGDQFEGNEAAFTALNLHVRDNLGGAYPLASSTPILQADFRSVAIHEWGHLIGLDHVDVTTATMFTFSPFTLGVLTRSVDVGSAKGAAVLYSIPVPEPTTWTVVLIAATCVGGLRRRAA